MNTTKSCFYSDTALMVWQENNCLQCKKAVWYNQRLKKMPQYRCAIQKQIEAQAAGEKEINKRTYEATREAVCPMLKSKEEREASAVLNFSEGESLVKKETAKASAVKDAPYLTPSAKKSEKPKNKPKKAEHDDVALLKLAQQTGVDYNALKEAEKRMSEAIKSGNAAPVLREADFKKQVKSDVGKMLETFSWKENMMIAFVPLVIGRLAWIYAEKVLRYCAENRIPETLKLGRAVKHVKEEYLGMLRKDLDARHIDLISNQTDRFYETYANDFLILWFSVNAAYLKQYPDAPYREMRVDAFISMLMCRYLYKHNRLMDKVIEEKMGFAHSIKDPNIVKLETCMDAYCGNFVIGNTPNIDACLRILQNNINAIDFEIDNDLPK